MSYRVVEILPESTLRNLQDITFIFLPSFLETRSHFLFFSPAAVTQRSLRFIAHFLWFWVTARSGSSANAIWAEIRSLTESPPGIGTRRRLWRRVAVGALEVDLAAVGEEEAEVSEHPGGRTRALPPREEVAVGIGVAGLLAGLYALNLEIRERKVV